MRQKYIITILLLLSVVAPLAALADSFYVNPVSLTPGKTGTLSFALENSQDIYGFQAEVKLPAGLTAVKAQEGKKQLAITLSDRAKDGDYVVNSNTIADGKLIMGAYSQNHKPFTGSKGNLVDLQVSVADDFAGGTVEVSNILLIDADDQDVELTPTSAAIGVAVSEITLSETACVLKVGGDVSLKATVTPANATDKNVKWTSSNTKIATVDVTGKVTAVAAGEAVITAAAGGKSATCKVTVKKAVESVTFKRHDVAIEKGKTLTLVATITPGDAIVTTATWTSSDPTVATVENGKITAVAVGTAVITATADGKSDSCTVTVKNSVATVTIDPTEASIEKGKTLQLKATVSPADAIDTTVTWSSSNSKIVTVDQNGMVTAVEGGSATITAASTANPAIKANCKVSVIVQVEGLEVQDPDLNPLESGVVIEINTGDSYDLTAVVKPANATNKKVTWTSSDEAVATVDANGLIDTHAAGEATITAAIAGFSFTAKVIVTDTEVVVTGITLDQTKAEMKTGATLQLTASVTPAEAADKRITWSSSNKDVATVSNGLVKALKAGTVTITATANKIKASCEITITDIEVTGVTLDKTEITSLMVGETVTLTAVVSPDEATDKTVTWTSSDENVASVDEEGDVTAVAPGTVTITATSGNVSAECKVTVVARPVPVEDIELSKTEATVAKGETLTLVAIVHPDEATDKTVTWSSSDEKVATVDQNGKVTAVNSGSAVITAAACGMEATCKVTVFVPVTSLVVLDEDDNQLKDGDVIEIHTGHEYNLTAVVGPEDATDKIVTWTTSDETVIKFLDDEGLIDGIKAGEATVTASIAGLSVTINVKVTDPVIPVTGVKLNKTTAELITGETLQLTATLEPEDATSKDITWTSSDKTIATVSTKGVVKALKAGKVTITATSNKISSKCEITITDPVIEVETITLNKTEATITIGETLDLEATVTPDNATDATVTWTSSDEAIATVDEHGTVKGIAIGNVVITAKAGDKTAECKVTVTPTSAVELIGFDPEAPVKVYDLNGVYVSDTMEGLRQGTYIVRQGDLAKKVRIR
ncbi:MAG: Ig-like domain-containing protein [Muribaculaceae bacterium]|nr:Ig-like domain-containing protein [Muribaculaceae bacterium]